MTHARGGFFKNLNHKQALVKTLFYFITQVELRLQSSTCQFKLPKCTKMGLEGFSMNKWPSWVYHRLDITYLNLGFNNYTDSSFLQNQVELTAKFNMSI